MITLKKAYSILLLILLIPAISQAQNPLAYAHHALFYDAGFSPYLEIYVSVEAASLQWHEEAKQWKAGALVSIFIEQSGKIENYDQFELLSKPSSDTLNKQFTIETMRRIAVAKGSYTLTIKFEDLFDKQSQSVEKSSKIYINPMDKTARWSDVVLLQHMQTSKKQNEFIRNGILMKPKLFSYYPSTSDSINFYAELYLIDSQYIHKDLVVFYSIHQNGHEKAAGTFQKIEKRKGMPVMPILNTIDIHDLPSGNYELVLELRSRSNQLLAKTKHFFQRSNPNAVADLQNVYLTDIDQTFVEQMDRQEIMNYLPAMQITASAVEQRAIADLLQLDKAELAKKFFYNFWLSRNVESPEKAWMSYKRQVDYVNHVYETSNRAGYQTDRGRVYIQYGAPTEITSSPSEANAAPYEIWQYNRIPNNETNVIFVFSEKDITNNDYFLIHSDATGEIHNDRWKMDIYKNFELYNSNDLDKTNPGQNFGTKPSNQYPR